MSQCVDACRAHTCHQGPLQRQQRDVGEALDSDVMKTDHLSAVESDRQRCGQAGKQEQQLLSPRGRGPVDVQQDGGHGGGCGAALGCPFALLPALREPVHHQSQQRRRNRGDVELQRVAPHT